MRYILLFAGILTLALTSCDPEDQFTTSGDDKLEFSVDTLRFDTVFTQLGSATRLFKVYNRSSKSIRIDRVYLPDHNNSRFRFNIDGFLGNDVEDVVIYPKDSIYVFAEVTINPDDPLSVSPFVINDEIIFETNGNEQMVTVEAWGQNANYFPNRFAKDDIVSLGCSGGDIVWDDPKPYVIYGIVVVENCNLIIPEGARIHVHGGLSRVEDMGGTIIYNSGRLQIGTDATLTVNGTPDNPVIFEGDRLEEGFQDEAGQWVGIVFSPGSKNNEVQHAIIKNSLIGMYVDSAAELSVKNTAIFNTSSSGLIGIHSEIEAENVLMYNNGSTSAILTYGGDYQFDYCTLASYGVQASALSLSNGIRFDDFNFCADFRSNDLEARFRNCIIHGSRRDEISLTDYSVCGVAVDFNYQFENCIVRYDELVDDQFGFPNFPDRCINCINITNTSDPIFVDVSEDIYFLDTLSAAEEQANPIPGIDFDLANQPRDPAMPDIGCYEYVPE